MLNLLLAFVLGLGAGTPGAALADDTEIYTGADSLAASKGVRPNVLIILDTSGSMSQVVPTDALARTRLDNMRDAVKGLLDRLNNVNVGLMRFHNPGGPILFPVSNIAADAAPIEKGTGSDILLRVSASTDDAEERVSTNVVDLTGPRLELAYTPAFGTSIARTAKELAGKDDAVEVLATGDTSNNTSPLPLSATHYSGFLFRDLNVPQGAYITAADISFYAAEASSSDTDLTFWGWATDNAGDFPVGAGVAGLSKRPRTAATAQWNGIATWNSGTKYVSDDVSAIVQEIVCRGAAASAICPGAGGAWAANNDVGIIAGGLGDGRAARSYEQDSAKAPVLNVKYVAPNPAAQLVGLRFQNVKIPQGVKIESAYLDFTPAAAQSGAVALRVWGEKVADALTHHATTEKVSEKLTRKTAASVDWDIADDWDLSGEGKTTPDLTGIVQEIVNQADWCGGNDLAFVIEERADNGGRFRSAFTYDRDPSRAPVLRVNFDETSEVPAGGGCLVDTVQRQVETSGDDAEENNATGAVSLIDTVLDLTTPVGGTAQTVGLRFQNVTIPPGAEILSAYLTLVADVTNAGSASLTIRGQADDDAGAFEAKDDNLSSRSTTAASVAWTASNWNSGSSYKSPDLKAVVQEIVCRGAPASAHCAGGGGGAWASGNDLALLVTGTNLQRARSYNKSASAAPTLVITTRGYLHDGTARVVTTVRQRLKEIVDGFAASGWTPLVDTLYEAAMYFRGGPVVYGANRGADGSTVERNTRVSHIGSWEGGVIERPLGCSEANLSAEACRAERISEGATYLTPMDDPCATNNIILLTDGEANNNHSVARIKELIGSATCKARFDDGTNVNKGDAPKASDECGVDLGSWLHTVDQSLAIAGDQKLTIFTIGFNLEGTANAHARAFLQDLAKNAGGEFRTADTAENLAAVFDLIFTEIKDRATSFAAPSLSVNAFNKLFHRNEVYLSLFQPANKIRWDGNVKRFQLRTTCTPAEGEEADPGCVLGEILDRSEPPKPAIESATARIAKDAWSFWSDELDGDELRQGGAANEVPGYAARNVYTYTGAAAPAGADLTAGANAVTVANGALTGALLGAAEMSVEEREALVLWIRGKDVDDEDRDGVTEESRYAFADPLHSSPIAVTYGGSDGSPVIKLFIGTNEGGLRMIDADSGTEDWIFLPQEVLAKQMDLRANPNGNHAYGMDGSPATWVRDADGDGQIEPSEGEFVRVYVGMRRGGSYLYALDASPNADLGEASGSASVSPELMWRIEGGSAAYPRLAQTWSRPLVTRILLGTDEDDPPAEPRTVLVFAGGYDPVQDGNPENPDGFGNEGQGNAIYVADAATGAQLLSISGHDPGSGTRVVVPEMVYPIPSDVALMDINGDGATDRLYVGDTGGQLWRVDLKPGAGAGKIAAVVGKLATVSGDAADADHRKFFYPPDVVQVLDSTWSDTPRYDLVTIVTGNRESPLSTAVEDRAYVFRDYVYGWLTDADGNGLADDGTYPTIAGPVGAGAGDLFDATSAVYTFDGEEVSADVTALRGAKGWYLDLPDSGEKGLSRPVVLEGKLFFTSYLPPKADALEAVGPCGADEGTGRLYGINVLNAAALASWGELGEDGAGGVPPRYQALGGGIPSGAIPIFQKEGVSLLIGTGGGAEVVDPGIGRPRVRSYWFEERP
jgi:type IV pilus assembly protein PilY1